MTERPEIRLRSIDPGDPRPGGHATIHLTVFDPGGGYHAHVNVGRSGIVSDVFVGDHAYTDVWDPDRPGTALVDRTDVVGQLARKAREVFMLTARAA